MSTSPALDPPIVRRAACVRADGWPCDACAGACPVGAIRFDDDGAPAIDADACTGCGSCVAACPASALAGGRLDVRHADGAAYVACAAAGGQPACVRAIPPERVLGSLTGGDDRIEVYTGDCAACPVAPRGDVVASIQALRASARACGLPHPVVARPEAEPPASGAQTVAMSRRQALTLLPAASVAAPAGSGGAGADGDRARFTAALGHDGWHPLYPSPRLRAACTGCGVCVRACPAGALSGADYGGVYVLSARASACLGCGVCAEACPADALALACDLCPPDPVIAKVYATHCADCGRALAAGETSRCTPCAARTAIAADVWGQLGY